MYVFRSGLCFDKGRSRWLYVGATFVAPKFYHEYIRSITASTSPWALCILCQCTVLSNSYTRPRRTSGGFYLFIFIIILSGVRLSPLGTAATTSLLYQPQMKDVGDCIAIGVMKFGMGNRSIRRKPAPAPLCPPHIPHDQTPVRTRAAAVRSQRLTS
jgi:hypothetical protein